MQQTHVPFSTTLCAEHMHRRPHIQQEGSTRGRLHSEQQHRPQSSHLLECIRWFLEPPLPGTATTALDSLFRGFSSSVLSSARFGWVLIIWLLPAGLLRSLWPEEELPTLVLMLLWESSALEDRSTPSLELSVFPYWITEGRLRRLLGLSSGVSCCSLVLELGDVFKSLFCCRCSDAGDLWATVGPSVYSLLLPVILIWSRDSTAGVWGGCPLVNPGSDGASWVCGGRGCGLPSSCGTSCESVDAGDLPWSPPPPSLSLWLLESISGLKGRSGWHGTHLKSCTRNRQFIAVCDKPCKWCHANHNRYLYRRHYGNGGPKQAHQSLGDRDDVMFGRAFTISFSCFQSKANL